MVYGDGSQQWRNGEHLGPPAKSGFGPHVEFDKGKVHFQWVLPHVNIYGNDLADTLAKKGLDQGWRTNGTRATDVKRHNILGMPPFRRV
ncbi:hypothetical protein TNCV_3499521 [Trichonephila clavipes]|nr:hypothetical protein TNCV_3499521 [Trichonephila clavipes]